MNLSSAQMDRACGVLVASAAGDALGAGYEFQHVPSDKDPGMIGGGLGGFEPGEWTDDTAQAIAIAQAAAQGLDLRTAAGLDKVARGFADWFFDDPPDVGIHTAAVLRRAGRNASASQMAEVAHQVHNATGRSAGNGSLMRTGAVALAYLDDPEALVEAAMTVSALTHYEDIAQEACAVWCLMIRHAVLKGDFPRRTDIEPWAPNPAKWREILSEAEAKAPSEFTTNGWAVGALQAAWSAIVHTPVPAGDFACRHLSDSLTTAIRIGHDTDTVAAIAGALLGARWGISAIPARWRRILHGWPGVTGRELEQLGFLAARGGKAGGYGWPLVDHIDYAELQYGEDPRGVHPFDDGVLLAGAMVLDALPDGIDAVVSLCLTGRSQVPSGVEHITFRLIDSADPNANPHLDFVLTDAARTVARLRDEGKRVVLHCVAAHSRTPAVGIAYALLRGVPLAQATPAVCGVLPAANPNLGFRAALARIEDSVVWD